MRVVVLISVYDEFLVHIAQHEIGVPDEGAAEQGRKPKSNNVLDVGEKAALSRSSRRCQIRRYRESGRIRGRQLLLTVTE
jgi:hypothetical protein